MYYHTSCLLFTAVLKHSDRFMHYIFAMKKNPLAYIVLRSYKNRLYLCEFYDPHSALLKLPLLLVLYAEDGGGTPFRKASTCLPLHMMLEDKNHWLC
jgi:hypothetical protein